MWMRRLASLPGSHVAVEESLATAYALVLSCFASSSLRPGMHSEVTASFGMEFFNKSANTAEAVSFNGRLARPCLSRLVEDSNFFNTLYAMKDRITKIFKPTEKIHFLRDGLEVPML